MLAEVRWQGNTALTPGKHSLVFDFKSDGPGFGKGGTGTLTIDGIVAASHAIPNTIPFLFPWDETFDIGSDTRTSADPGNYHVPFAFNRTIDKLTVKLNPVQ